MKNEKEPQASRQAQLPSSPSPSPSPFPISYTYSYSTPSPYRRADDGHVTDICLTHVRHLTDKRQFFFIRGRKLTLLRPGPLVELQDLQITLPFDTVHPYKTRGHTSGEPLFYVLVTDIAYFARHYLSDQ